jgi:hypothetical protein
MYRPMRIVHANGVVNDEMIRVAQINNVDVCNYDKRLGAQ